MRFASLQLALRRPAWGWGRLLAKTVSAERAARWRGFGTAADCARRVRAAVADARGPVFVFPLPTVAWGYLFQRPQQMARALSRLGFTVLYAADPVFAGSPDLEVRGLARVSERLYLYNDGRGGRMIRALDRPVVAWCYWPHHARFLENLPPGARCVYDHVDEVALFEQYTGIEQDHDRFLREADVVVATARKLLDRIRDVRPDAQLVPNACVCEDFARPATCEIPGLARLRRESRVIVGYYGALAEWLDWELLRQAARARREWTFLLVGDDWAGVARRERITEEPNITVWPRQPYERLGHLLANFDVAMVPFQVNAITDSVSPIKLFEYMAGGKPVVSAPLSECRRYPAVRLAENPAEFVAQVEWCLTEGRRAEHIAELRACAAANTWEQRAEAVVGLLGIASPSGAGERRSDAGRPAGS